MARQEFKANEVAQRASMPSWGCAAGSECARPLWPQGSCRTAPPRCWLDGLAAFLRRGQRPYTLSRPDTDARPRLWTEAKARLSWPPFNKARNVYCEIQKYQRRFNVI
ncbi:hypothetical protein M2323_001812 [Rhodoblastus acidophilus]|nr:hypothetical protein [Rhodoblastus acidophilus]MCW2332895.1 hypothetical protein [Rhodoblastus acidophilus]